MPCKQSVSEFIDNLEPKMIDEVIKGIINGHTQCKDESCDNCRLYKKLAQCKEILVDPEKLYFNIMTLIISPENLILAGFLLALTLVEVKELEQLEQLEKCKDA